MSGQYTDGTCRWWHLSRPSPRAAPAAHPGATFLLAGVLRLPLRDGCADLLIDRGCFATSAQLTGPGRAPAR